MGGSQAIAHRLTLDVPEWGTNPRSTSSPSRTKRPMVRPERALNRCKIGEHSKKMALYTLARHMEKQVTSTAGRFYLALPSPKYSGSKGLGDWDALLQLDFISHRQQCEQGTHSSR